MKRMKKLFVLFALSAAMVVTGADLYVLRKGGKNNNPGTKAKPFRNLWKAIDKANPGDVIFLPAISVWALLKLPKG